MRALLKCACTSDWSELLDAGKTLSRDERAGLERPLRSFGHKHLAKSGVAPAQSEVLLASKLIIAPSVTIVFPCYLRILAVTRKVTGEVMCVFHAPVTQIRLGPVPWAGATATISVATQWGRSCPFRVLSRFTVHR